MLGGGGGGILGQGMGGIQNILRHLFFVINEIFAVELIILL